VDGRILPKLTQNLLKRLGVHGYADRQRLLDGRAGWAAAWRPAAGRGEEDRRARMRVQVG
jgi:hypothetical protein